MVTISITRIRCLLHKLDLIWIWSREDGRPNIREHSEPWKLELVAWWTYGNLQENPNPKYDGSLMWNLWRCVETYTSEKMEVNQLIMVSRILWIGRVRNQENRLEQVSSKFLHVCLPARCWNLTNASCTSEFQISCKWAYMWILAWNHKRNGL